MREIVLLKERFEFALETMSRGLSMFDHDHRLIVCNSRYIELYDLPSSLAVPGTTFDEIFERRLAAGTARDRKIEAARSVGPPRRRRAC